MENTYPPTITGRRRTLKLQKNGNVIKLDNCSDKNFISPIIVTVKQDTTIKIAMDSKVINKAIHKNKYQMQNIDCLMDNIAQSILEFSHESEVFFPLSIYDTRIANYHSTKQPQNIAISTS